MTRLPGLLLCAAATVALLALAPLTPAVSPLVLALVLGAAVGTAAGAAGRRSLAAGRRWAAFAPGTAVVARRVLRIGIVLLGLRLSVPDVLALGWRGLVVMAGTLAVTFAGTLLLGRRLGTTRDESLLVATGFAVCGAAAVSAMTGVLERGRPRETPHERAERDRALRDAVAAALALVTAYGTLAIVALPPLARLLGLDDAQAGLWIGASVQEVAQVVAAAGAVSTTALATATVAKLARVVLLAPLVAGVGTVLGRRDARAAGPRDGDAGARRPAPVPLFVAGFLAAVAVRSLGVLPEPVLAAADTVTTVLFVAAMFALGLGVDVPRLLRTGRRTLLLGGLAALLTIVTGLVLVLLLG
ncbi:YeiH family protein [Puerhibacterium sp. TATVAM-FAB25]|uniref:YeiH family protein n=1 Tax=Puerhibacterium sp. TATVAM-FAB25 TaxID=3093699 RepID=UPI00397BEC3A